jgi:hypothetical protein
MSARLYDYEDTKAQNMTCIWMIPILMFEQFQKAHFNVN